MQTNSIEPVKRVIAAATRSSSGAPAASSRRRRSSAAMLRASAVLRLPGWGAGTVGPSAGRFIGNSFPARTRAAALGCGSGRRRFLAEQPVALGRRLLGAIAAAPRQQGGGGAVHGDIADGADEI